MNIVYFKDFAFPIQRIPEYRCLLIGRVQFLYTIEDSEPEI